VPGRGSHHPRPAATRPATGASPHAQQRPRADASSARPRPRAGTQADGLAWLERQADLAEAIVATRQAEQPPGQPKAGGQRTGPTNGQ
jgi:hypothetical protein